MPLDSSNLFMFVAIAFLVVMMFLNTRKRKKQQTEMNQALKPGAWIMTTSGIFAEVKSIEEDKLVIESTPGVKLILVKGAVARVVDAPAIAVAAPAAKAAAKPAAKPAAKKPAAKKAAPAAQKPAAKKPAAAAAKK
jgi:preprotein translocase subunit YajC